MCRATCLRKPSCRSETVLIDTHCHLDAPEFASDRACVVARARAAGVQGWIIPAVACAQFETVKQLAHAAPFSTFYTLGIHPLFVPHASEVDLQRLAREVNKAMDDPCFVGIGEIGLDFFVPELTTPAMRNKQEYFYRQQLALAQRHKLPVILHVRRSQDVLFKYLRQQQRQTGASVGGIAHAFNGSFQQAQQFVGLGFALGFGGAMTFTRARQIRRLAAQLPDHAWVLETDAPDIAPAWLAHSPAHPSTHPPRNEPAQLPRIAQTLAELRHMTVDDIIKQNWRNACRVIPRLAATIRPVSTP